MDGVAARRAAHDPDGPLLLALRFTWTVILGFILALLAGCTCPDVGGEVTAGGGQNLEKLGSDTSLQRKADLFEGFTGQLLALGLPVCLQEPLAQGRKELLCLRTCSTKHREPESVHVDIFCRAEGVILAVLCFLG